MNDEDRYWLGLLPGVLETVYSRAMIETAVYGMDQEPKRENIDKTIAVIRKLLSRGDKA